MLERSLSMREVAGSMPASSIGDPVKKSRFSFFPQHIYKNPNGLKDDYYVDMVGPNTI